MEWFDLERWDRFDIEIAVAIAGHEVVLEINLHDETLARAQLLAERFARSSKIS